MCEFRTFYVDRITDTAHLNPDCVRNLPPAKVVATVDEALRRFLICRRCSKAILPERTESTRQAAPLPGPKTSKCAACRTGKGRHTCGLSGLQKAFRIG